MSQNILKNPFGCVDATKIWNVLRDAQNVGSLTNVVVNVVICAFISDLCKASFFRAESFVEIKKLQLKKGTMKVKVQSLECQGCSPYFFKPVGKTL